MISKITCAGRVINASRDSLCSEASREKNRPVRCIDVPLNQCRAKPINTKTGKNLQRVFTVKNEGIKAKWW